MIDWDQMVEQVRDRWIPNGKLIDGRTCVLGAAYLQAHPGRGLHDPHWSTDDPYRDPIVLECASVLAPLIRAIRPEYSETWDDTEVVWRFNDTEGHRDCIEIVKKARAKLRG